MKKNISITNGGNRKSHVYRSVGHVVLFQIQYLTLKSAFLLQYEGESLHPFSIFSNCLNEEQFAQRPRISLRLQTIPIIYFCYTWDAIVLFFIIYYLKTGLSHKSIKFTCVSWKTISHFVTSNLFSVLTIKRSNFLSIAQDQNDTHG